MAPPVRLLVLACAARLADCATFNPARTLLTLSKQDYDSAQPLPILSPVPFTGSWTGGWTMRVSAELAMDIINSQQVLLPGYRLNTSWFDDRCDANYNVQLFTERWNDGTPWVAMGANGCSAVCLSAGLVAPKLRLPYVSYACASGALNDTKTYPDFGRLIADESTLSNVYQSLAKIYKWTSFFIISADPARFDGPSQAVVNYFQKNTDPLIQVQWLTPRNPTWAQLLIMMRDIKRSLQRVVIVFGYEPFYRQVLCAAYQVGMTVGSVWLSVGWHADEWWLARDDALLALNPKCTPELLTQYANGGIGADGLGAPKESAMDRQLDCMPGWTPRQFRDLVEAHYTTGYPLGQNALPAPPYSNLKGNGADGICMWAFMLRHMLFDLKYNLSQLVRPSAAVYQQMRDFLKVQLDFFGVTGPFKFQGNNLPGIYGVTQIQNGQRLLVGTVDLQGALDLTPGLSLLWGDNSTAPATFFPACADGYRRLQNGVCEPCRPGAYEDAQLHDCMPCPAGKSSAAEAAIGAASCRRCRSGQVANATGSSACTDCPAGTFADPADDAAVQCTLCHVGTSQATPGVSACTRCELGRYEEHDGSTACDQCPERRTTRFLAALSTQECVCPVGTFDRPGLGCVDCLEGLTCPGDEEPPVQDAGFWAQVLDNETRDYSVYKCRTLLECPVSPLGTCPEGRKGISCARCQPGRYPSSLGPCLVCNSTGRALPFVIGGLAIIVAGVLAICLFGQGAGQTSSMLTLTIILGQIAATVQSLGAFQQFQIKWIEPIGSFLRGISLLTFDFDVIRVSCAMPSDDPVSRLVIQLLAFPAALGALGLAYLTARALHKRHPQILRMKSEDATLNVEPLINAAGMLSLAAFIPLTLTTTEAMRCLRNPNGTKSMAKNPSVICWSSREHQTLVALSIIGLVLYPVLIMAVVSRATTFHDSWLSTGHGISKLRAHRFLFDRFTPLRYRFGLFYLLRNAIIAIIPAALVGLPMLQVLSTIMVFLVSLVVQVSWWPWRTNQANYTDMLANMGLTFFLAASAFLLDVSADDSTSTLQVLLAGALIIVTIALLSGVTGAIRGRLCAKKPYAMFLCHHKAGAGVLCRYIKVVVKRSSKVDVFLDSDQLEDLANIVEAVRAWTENLVVVLSKDLLKRIWCASEIVSGHVNKVPTVCVVCDDFVPMRSEERARLAELWTPEQRATALTPYQLTMDMVVAAYSWLDDLKHRIQMPRFGTLAEKGQVVVQLMDACSVGRRGGVIGAPGKSASILLLGAVSDAESLSTCEVVALILQFELQAEAVVVRSAEDAAQHTRTAKYAVIMLSHGLLEDEAFASSLLAVVKAPGRREPVEIVTVLAAGTANDQFSFPDGDFYDDLEANNLGQVNGKEIAMAYRDMLLILALPFSPLGSMGLIEKQLSEISRRFRKLRVEDNQGMTSKATTNSSAATVTPNASALSSPRDAGEPFEVIVTKGFADRPYLDVDGDDGGWLSERSL